MPVPGYDPEDLDDTLESLLDDQTKKEYLSDDEWDAYQRGDASLVDLLEGSEIERLLDQVDESSDTTLTHE